GSYILRLAAFFGTRDKRRWPPVRASLRRLKASDPVRVRVCPAALQGLLAPRGACFRSGSYPSIAPSVLSLVGQVGHCAPSRAVTFPCADRLSWPAPACVLRPLPTMVKNRIQGLLNRQPLPAGELRLWIAANARRLVHPKVAAPSDHSQPR